jgi:hypothetical protein
MSRPHTPDKTDKESAGGADDSADDREPYTAPPARVGALAFQESERAKQNSLREIRPNTDGHTHRQVVHGASARRPIDHWKPDMLKTFD